MDEKIIFNKSIWIKLAQRYRGIQTVMSKKPIIKIGPQPKGIQTARDFIKNLLD
jgi:hypothetical protein